MDDIQRQAMILVSHIYLTCGKVEKALTILEGVRDEMKDSVYVPRALSLGYVRMKRFEDALRESEVALGRAETRRDRRCSLLLKAQALWGLKRDAERRQVVKELLTSGEPEGGNE
jgi:hypothetical protein